VNDLLDRINWKIVSYVSIMLLICVFAFLVAKYVVRSNIPQNEVPIDTSTRI